MRFLALNFSFTVCFWIIVSTLSQWTNAELYTAVADLEDLLQTEAKLLKTMESYIIQQEMKLVTLKRYSISVDVGLNNLYV